jgi:hypothetical protein
MSPPSSSSLTSPSLRCTHSNASIEPSQPLALALRTSARQDGTADGDGSGADVGGYAASRSHRAALGDRRWHGGASAKGADSSTSPPAALQQSARASVRAGRGARYIGAGEGRRGKVTRRSAHIYECIHL